MILRDVTERPEAVEVGAARVVGTSPERIVCETARLLDDRGEHAKMASAGNPYGDGHAAERIVGALLEPFRAEPARGLVATVEPSWNRAAEVVA